MFLLYSPLNQGLKLLKYILPVRGNEVFTLQSIKSRIETNPLPPHQNENSLFLLYSPLNQGLKLIEKGYEGLLKQFVFTLQSIKSRIETGRS